ncbi:hypothetical protein DNTS_015583 [Danionella cerebrum]|uniref:Uncharacterized protein n=1 Tax=Danionella cerebrum TaxID=2873325 RepID=A0A553R1R7_9TELE|nr:hypothetical protein DNTS_015583 [Danionella translucida]
MLLEVPEPFDRFFFVLVEAVGWVQVVFYTKEPPLQILVIVPLVIVPLMKCDLDLIFTSNSFNTSLHFYVVPLHHNRISLTQRHELDSRPHYRDVDQVYSRGSLCGMIHRFGNVA